jgi:hypothetical protein
MPEQPQKSRVTLTFNRTISPEEMAQLQTVHDAIESVALEGHHDHDHPSIVADLGQNQVIGQ